MIPQNDSSYLCKSLDDTRLAGHAIADALGWPSCVYLEADMGAGKTTLCQSIIAGLGYQGRVTSPTYNLIQEYPVSAGVVYHMDLYRLEDPLELESLAIEDLWSARSIFLIEWPNKVAGRLPLATHQLSITKSICDDSDVREIVFGES